MAGQLPVNYSEMEEFLKTKKLPIKSYKKLSQKYLDRIHQLANYPGALERDRIAWIRGTPAEYNDDPYDYNNETVVRLEDLTGNGKPSKSITLYYANWCPHCKPMIPMFKKLKIPGVEVRMLEQAENDEFEAEGYPTIVYRDGSEMEMYNGPRGKTDIVKFVKNKL